MIISMYLFVTVRNGESIYELVPEVKNPSLLESGITWAADHLGSPWSSPLRRGIGVDVTLITMANKDLLYSTRNYTQYLVITYNGKESKN